MWTAAAYVSLLSRNWTPRSGPGNTSFTASSMGLLFPNFANTILNRYLSSISCQENALMSGPKNACSGSESSRLRMTASRSKLFAGQGSPNCSAASAGAQETSR